jgi:hypothetical protein
MTSDHTQSGSGAERPSMADSTQLSEMLDVLSCRPRRRILFHLLRDDDPISVTTLIEQIDATGVSDPVNGELVDETGGV